MWDEEIDKAARDITDGEPAVDLKTRVLARIAVGRPQRLWWIAAPAAAALILVVALIAHSVFGAHTDRGGKQVAEAQAPREPRTAAAEQQPQRRGEPVVVRVAEGAQRAHVSGAVVIAPRPVAAPKATGAIRVEPGVDALENDSALLADGDLAPLRIEPIGVAPIQQPTPITIEPVVTEPIELHEIELPSLAQ